MSRRSVIIVGSGAGGSVAAWRLARAGHPVLILEKGRNLFPELLDRERRFETRFSNDEVKAGRFFENQDPLLEPRTARTQREARRGVARSFVGDVNDLPTTVGGGTVHWDAKVPRFWRQDFKGLSRHGPVAGANVADWPLTYDELAPYYERVERRIGVQGDRDRMPARTLAQAPRRHQFPMRPNPPAYAGKLLAAAAASVGFEAYPFPMAVNSRHRDGRPACNSCGFCSGFGCPIQARGGALSWLPGALAAGAELRDRCFVERIEVSRDGRRATGVVYIDRDGRRRRERADVVIVAASAIETARLLLLSRHHTHPRGLGNRSGQLGRNLMFHHFTIAGALFDEDVHAWMCPSTTFTIDDFVGPVRGAAARAAGLPYLKGGVCEVGAGVTLLQEAQIYAMLPNGFGVQHKNELRTLALRRHLAAIQLVGEDMPQLGNRVDLDPRIRDFQGLPVPRITHSPHRFELAASEYYAPKLAAICDAATGSVASTVRRGALAAPAPRGADIEGPFATAHIMGTARMGADARRSVSDRFGRVHEVDNLFLADGSVFASSGGFNPTLTIMALALRQADHIAGRGHAARSPTVDQRTREVDNSTLDDLGRRALRADR
jgi:choline dehydrogenase-like flavoprotein